MECYGIEVDAGANYKARHSPIVEHLNNNSDTPEIKRMNIIG